ncbi:MAG: hypothetical protein PWQ51_146 [Methanolobus sp.]|jgi:hypothetical protein|uniref:DUF4130 domain-containing protein n=1 Tax=Methanolobus sp. TaxID=1874737 RepID=UPI0024ABBA2F|nr:DUF4130 domain-containing protein [Methanolobus sp.]MDI3485757.1 hypothetical protein [Methanolobus sp.]MDK2832710.1 hypothetical protein [Methanolobus sp.]MDK2937982.1 hypothetical protein [Methanolobus sp.]
MIVAFRENVEGVLLACAELMANKDCKLISAKDRESLKQKMEFAGITDVKMLGFRATVDTSKIVCHIFGSQRARMFQRDPDVEGYISMVLRHRSSSPIELVNFLVSCEGNVELLYSGKTRTGKKYYNYMRDVSRSYHRLCMFARPYSVNGVLSVKVDSPHHIGDMFCRWLARKNPDLPVAVIQRDVAWIGNGRHVGLDHYTNIPASLAGSLEFISTTDEIDDLWDMYYDSQAIPKRRNKTHAKQLQPKTSASMSKMSERDRYKVERGIANCTLDNFASGSEV